VIAELSKKSGALTVAVVTIPFAMEGHRRYENAVIGLEKLEKSVDTLIVIPNDKLLELASNDKNIIALTSDARGSVTLDKYAEQLPEQFVELGIAEQNAVGVAAGMALSGKNTFVCGPACFYSARSFEQVKVDVAYTKTNVKVVGVSGGVSYGALGSTHHSLHDIAAMRALPDLTVIFPCDIFQTRKMTESLAHFEGPAYVRMGRGAVPNVYENEDTPFEIGKANILSSGSDITLIGCGETVYHAFKAGELLKEEGISARVIDMHTLKPLDEDAVKMAINETGAILTVEEHSIHGGLGAAVAEIVVQNKPVPMRIMGIPDENSIHGSSKDIFNHYGINAENIALEAKKLIDRK
jgi:transketolase